MYRRTGVGWCACPVPTALAGSRSVGVASHPRPPGAKFSCHYGKRASPVRYSTAKFTLRLCGWVGEKYVPLCTYLPI